jgi:ATP-dependent exoDNAse (exonuclease V) beta subunit
MSAPPADARVREKALDPDRSVILESPAGSGKTALLAARYLTLLARVAHPRQILAVTFTNRAAAEMADRITRALKRALAGETGDGGDSWEDRFLGLAHAAVGAHRGMGDLLLSRDTLQIGTFHGFCASVARGWPLEADVPPGLGLLEPAEQEELLASCVSETLAAVSAGRATPEETAAFKRRLASADNSVGTIREQLLDLLRRRDRLLPLASLLAKEGMEGFARQLEARAVLLGATFMEPLRDHFGARAKAWAGLRSALEAAGAIQAEKLAAAVPGTAQADVSSWRLAAEVFLTGDSSKAPGSRKVRAALTPKSGFPEGFKNHPASGLIVELPPEVAVRLAFVASWPEAGAGGEGVARDRVGAAALADMVCLAGAVLDRFRRARDARGMDFNELESAALRALGRVQCPSESLVFFHEHLRHLLVDEAQDVNDAQVGILSILTQGWEPHGANTVFVVGDPKQSIYRFRRAEVALFRGLQREGLPREGEPAFPLEDLRLTANFRSRPPLVDFANALFAKVMASPDEAQDEVAFAPSEAAREVPAGPAAPAGTPDDSSPVSAALFTCRTGKNRAGDQADPEQARGREAAFVAGRVSALLSKGVTGGQVALLIPARTHLSPFVAALEELGIPLRIREGRPMLDAPEVRHLLNLFRALVRPYDDIAWVGAARAPWCRVPLVALEASSASGPGLWSDRLKEARHAHPRLERFAAALDEAAGAFGREPFAVTLQRLWETLDGPAVAALASGPAGVANAMALFELLGKCPSSPGEEALARIERLLETAYTPPDPRGAVSGVQVMTIHGSKGLEFDHVFAVDMDYRPGRGRGEAPAFLMDRVPGGGRVPLAAATADRRTGEKVLAHALLSELGRGRERAEFKRQFYVAATRARETLTLSGLDPRRKDGTPSTQAGPALTAVEEAWEEGLIGSPFFSLERDPAIAPVASQPALAAKLFPEAPPFEPESLTYAIASPSEVEEETAQAVRPGADEPDPEARARGVVLHRIFETMAHGERPPGSRAIAVALTREGVPPARATALAGQVVEEARLAWEFPPFGALREGADVVAEWPLEDFDGQGRVRVGRLDLLLRTPSGRVILDFKTGRPGPDLSAWIQSQRRMHGAQLRAYAEMARRAEPESQVRTALFFTGVPHLEWMG